MKYSLYYKFYDCRLLCWRGHLGVYPCDTAVDIVSKAEEKKLIFALHTGQLFVKKFLNTQYSDRVPISV